MATTVRSSSQFSSGGTTSVDLTAPTGTTTGDLVIVVIDNNSNSTVTDNNGTTPFTKDFDLNVNTTTGLRGTVWSRRIQAGDPSTYHFAVAFQRCSGIAVTFQNPNATTIYDVVPTSATASSTAGSAPTITTITANAIHCACMLGDNATTTITATPAGYNVEQNTGANQVSAFTDKVIASPGATGAQSFTLSVTGDWIGISFAIADVGSAATTLIAPKLLYGIPRLPIHTPSVFIPQGTLAAAQSLTLAGAEGAFTISGQNVTLQAGMPGAEGAFSISGQAAVLQVGQPGAEGIFTISGQTATLAVGMPGAEGAFAISGQLATLQVGMPGAEGAFVISGQAAALNKALKLAGAEGAFVINGQAATLGKLLTLSGAEGAFTISGQAAGMLRGIKLAGAEGAFAINGKPATELRGIKIPGGEGAFVINGQAAALTRGLHLAGAEGSFVISGKSAAFPVALSIRGAEGAFSIVGGAATLTYTPSGVVPAHIPHNLQFHVTVGRLKSF